MPLPFLKPKAVAGLIISQRKPDGGKEELHSEGNEDQGLESAMGDFHRALAAKDEKSMAAAFRAAVQMLDSQEEPSEESNDFDSLNAKAAQERK